MHEFKTGKILNMVIGTLSIKIVLNKSHSLKDRIRNKFNVSISETGAQDNHKYSIIGVAMVGTDKQYVNSVLSSLINFSGFSPKSRWLITN